MKAILTFHSIDDSGGVLSFPPSSFARLVEGLMADGIAICSLDELLQEGTERAVSITFDDGMQSVHEHALPVLRSAGVPAHLYLTTGFVGRDNRWPTQPAASQRLALMDWDQVAACAEAGVLVENHTVNHPDLRGFEAGAIEAECARADEAIEERLGRRPQHFAYPYGYLDATLQRVAGQRYLSCVTTEMRRLRASDPRDRLPRLDSYYLKHSRHYQALFSPGTRAYLFARNCARRLKQGLSS